MRSVAFQLTPVTLAVGATNHHLGPASGHAPGCSPISRRDKMSAPPAVAAWRLIFYGPSSLCPHARFHLYPGHSPPALAHHQQSGLRRMIALYGRARG